MQEEVVRPRTREEPHTREDEYLRARNHKPARYHISNSWTHSNCPKSYWSFTFLSVLLSRPPPPTQHYENINQTYMYADSPYSPRPPSRPEAYKGSHETKWGITLQIGTEFNLVSFSFRCPLQTVTISHCCPIMSPSGPLFCESTE